MKKLLLFAVFIALLSGCAAKNEYKVTFLNHEKEFKKQNTFTTHKIKRYNYFLHAREFGEENRGNEPTILLMHGFPDNLHLYDELVPYLSKNRHVITFDFLGWGDSDKPKNHTYTTQSLKKDMQTVIDYFKLDDIVVVVHDASGPVGIEWALENESKINTLVLLNTYYQPTPSLKAPDAIELFSTPGIKRSLAIFFTSISDARWQSGMIEQVNQFISDDKKRALYAKIFAYKALGIRKAFFGLNDVLVQEVESRRDTAAIALAKFHKPVIIVFGEDDKDLNVGVAKEFHNLFPNSTLHIIKKAGHFVQIDKPKSVAEFILKQ